MAEYMRSCGRIILIGLMLFLSPMAVAAGFAAGLNDLKKPYTHSSQREPLAALLSDFAVSQGYSASFTNKIDGLVNGEFTAMPPRSFLAAMRAGYGVEAYTLNSTMYFFHQSERRREVLRINSMLPSEMRRALLRMGALSEDLPSDTSRRERLLFLEGPEGYVAGLIASIRILEDAQHEEMAIRVFPLKHAWADDTNIEGATGLTVLPGVASVLRAIATGQPAVTSPAARTLHSSESGPALMGTGLVGRRTEAAEKPAAKPATAGPNIIAEPRSNAVIITDRQSRMEYYEAVIAALDKPMDLVEIHAAIVDINASYTRSLGVNWGGERLSGDFAGSVGSLGAPGAAPAAGFAVTTLYNTALNSLFSNIQALEERGDGAVLSRPSVLTVDNVQASLEYTTTFYIKLQGVDAVDMVPVTSGTVLKVTPRILRMPDGKPSRLSLTIVISDGSDPLSVNPSSWVDGIPPVKKVTINTQAMVAEGQSLLLGGFYYERRSDDQSGVPWLMNIPLLGALFRRAGADVQRMERMIIISPRIISYDFLDVSPPDRVEAQRFALSPEAAHYELKEDFYDTAPRGSGCFGSVARPEGK
ncbi:MAG: type III secretion system outer membrane ring subunit SctC [Deltaproteobacteria bacterium]|jgi:type III secretion protein C|nr:type III secretion system outer membrane ring subunit SctC [Deltaproteobacteria bacterium]